MLGSRWFITGGGNNRAGCSDVVALGLGGLGRGGTLAWTHVVDVEPRSALASEGLSLLAVPQARCYSPSWTSPPTTALDARSEHALT